MLFDDPFGLFDGGPIERFLERFPRTPDRTPNPHGLRRGQGSGFLVSDDGLILTNSHVVQDASRINVRLHDGRRFNASLVGSDPESDVALLRIEAKDLPSLTLGDSDKLRLAEAVLAIGNPFGLTETVTTGVVSAKGRTHVGLTSFENYIQTDAAINPGNSGGPLLNLKGEVVGINAAIYSRSGGHMGIGFAIPINFAKSIQAQLLDSGEVVRGFLGVLVQDVTPDLASSLGLEMARGALVAEVNEGSPADAAGLEAGDVVVRADGSPLRDSGTLRNEIARRKPGTKVALDIVRQGKSMALQVELAERERGPRSTTRAWPKVGTRAPGEAT